MTKCNTSQLLAPELEAYLIKRRNEVSTDLDRTVRLMSTPGSDTIQNSNHRQTLLGRLTELDTLRQTMEADETAKRQNELDRFEDSLNGTSPEREEILKRYDVNERGVITSPGKFEGEMLYAPYFWDWILNGDGETMQDDDGTECTVLDVTPEDREMFPEIPASIYKVALLETDQGFVYLTDNETPGFNELGTDEDRKNRAEAEQEAYEADDTPSLDVTGTVFDPAL